MQKMTSNEAQAVIDYRLKVLDTVLLEECAYVDRAELGARCGFNFPWWSVENRLTIDDYFRLLQHLHANDVPDVALRVASRARLDKVGVIGYAILSRQTLGEALELAGHLAKQIHPYMKFQITESDKHALLSCIVLAEGEKYYQQALDIWVISLWRYIQTLLPKGIGLGASFVKFGFSALSYCQQYEQLLGCPVTFDHPQTVIAIPRPWLALPVHKKSAAAQSLYSYQVGRSLKGLEHNGDMVTKIKRLLLERPSECLFRLENAAKLLSVSERTLRRHLADAGVSFRQLSLEIRMELAKDYLLFTQLTAQEIAYQVGYSQPNNFYRAFKDYYQASPEKYRLEFSGRETT